MGSLISALDSRQLFYTALEALWFDPSIDYPDGRLLNRYNGVEAAYRTLGTHPSALCSRSGPIGAKLEPSQD
jgi:hypothetical protein